MTAPPIGIEIPGRVLAYWPGNPLHIAFNWDVTDPTGGHVWTVDAVRGDAGRPSARWPAVVVVDGQEITATWDEDDTAAFTPGAFWRLLRDDETVLAGKLLRDTPTGADALEPTINVELIGPPAVTIDMTVYQLRPALDSIVHDWDVDGWTPWTVRRFSSDGVATQTPSVTVARRGRITGQADSAGGNMRQAYLRHDTEWANSRVKALWLGSNIYASATATPQMGLVLRGQIDPDTGEFIAVVISNNIYLSNPDVINCNLWYSDATQDNFVQGDVLGQKTFNTPLVRSLALVSTMRFNFVTWINSHSVTPKHLYGLAQGDLIDINSADATFTVTAAPCTGASEVGGSVSVDELTVGHQAAVALKIDTGFINPPMHKKFWPMWMIAELVGNQLRFKVWRYLDEEPDWGQAANVQTYDISASTTLTEPIGPGFCGVIASHHRNSSYQEFGYLEFTELP